MPKSTLGHKNARLLLAICWTFCFVLSVSFRPTLLPDDLTSRDDFLVSVHACQNILTSVSTSENSTVPTTISDLLAEVEHTFVVSVQGCRTTFPPGFAGNVSCILGNKIDKCAPRKFISGSHEHAMRVTYTHAVILQLSIEAGFQNVAVLEDDLQFSQTRSYVSASDLRRLLVSSSWSFIRFGYRPYFLQADGISPCPSPCRCSTSAKYGQNLCKLHGSGCDMRSSDFYIVSSATFFDFQSHMLDVKLSNSKRIIDVYPMRAFSKQWLVLPQVSFQGRLDIPSDYQLGLGALYVKKCAGPRPLPVHISEHTTLSSC